MEKYTSPMNTPLKFHKFYLFLIIPVNIIYESWGFLQFIKNPTIIQSALGGRYKQAIFLSAFSILISILIFSGVFRWRPYSLACIMIQAGGTILISLSNLYVYLAHYSNIPNAIRGVGEYSLRAMIWILIFIYYLRRRLLFFRRAHENLREEVTNQASASTNDHSNKNVIMVARKQESKSCPECGNILFESDQVCTKCGKLFY